MPSHLDIYLTAGNQVAAQSRKSASKEQFQTPQWGGWLASVGVTPSGWPYEPTELEEDRVVWARCQGVVHERKKFC